MGGAKARPASRLSGGLAPARGLSDLPILSRHARSGVPSSVASSQRYRNRINALQSTSPAGGRIRSVKNSAAKASKGRHVKARPCPKPYVPRTVPKGPKWQSPFPRPRTWRQGAGIHTKAGRRGLRLSARRHDRLYQGSPRFLPAQGAFARLGTEIVGISADSVAALDPFKSKHKLTIALVSDETRKALEAYGAWQQKSLHGRKIMGAVRATFLIGLDQRIERVWPRVSVAGPLKFAAIAKH